MRAALLVGLAGGAAAASSGCSGAGGLPADSGAITEAELQYAPRGVLAGMKITHVGLTVTTASGVYSMALNAVGANPADGGASGLWCQVGPPPFANYQANGDRAAANDTTWGTSQTASGSFMPMSAFLNVVDAWADAHPTYSLHACNDGQSATANCQMTTAYLWKVLTGTTPKVCPDCLPECMQPSPAPAPPAPAPPAPTPPGPEPHGCASTKCASCCTGACAACKACVGVKTGQCAACYTADPTLGTACLYDDGHGCQRCWSPAPPAPPAPAPPAPTPPGPGPHGCASPKCASCCTGACAACKACVGVKTGQCAACYQPDPTLGTACLYDDGHGCQKCWAAGPAPPGPPGPAPPMPSDGHPPPLAPQFTATLTQNGASATVYSDEATKRVAAYSGATYTIIDCNKMVKYTNSNPYAWPPGAVGPCVTSTPMAYLDCPTAGIPGADPWPPSSYSFYGGERGQATYQGKVPCAKGMCDKYSFTDAMRGAAATFLIDSRTQMPYQSTLESLLSMKKTTIVILNEVNAPPPETAFAKPANCSGSGPAPGPAPPPSDCKKALEEAGCLPNKPEKCHDCNKDHKSELAAKGCTHKECDKVCGYN